MVIEVRPINLQEVGADREPINNEVTISLLNKYNKREALSPVHNLLKCCGLKMSGVHHLQEMFLQRKIRSS